ncbi:HGGxSTG domain-containing protein [Tsuneonella deserti]|uniref:HGGxSTG domain-containing protein n=1 Tax=Tsuneonella deserti TaxID=2035528 RepID=UPI003570F53B
MISHRNYAATHEAPRCSAKTRRGSVCKSPAVAGRSRCRMHGGAHGSGAPLLNQNALKHGLHTREEREHRLKVRSHVRQCREALNMLN